MEEAGWGDQVEYELRGKKHEEGVGVADCLKKDVDDAEEVLEETKKEKLTSDGMKQDQLQQQQQSQPATPPQQQQVTRSCPSLGAVAAAAIV